MNDTTSTKKPKLRTVHVTVNAFTDISPQLRRITFTAPEIAHFPAQSAAAHIKVFLPRSGQTMPSLPQLTDNGVVWPEPERKPIVRTYSVRECRPMQQEIDIEFVLHGEDSPAASFAKNVDIGQCIGISQPSPCSLPLDKGSYYFVGDCTAIPAIASQLEILPKDVSGDVFIHVQEASHKLSLLKPPHVNLHWFVGDAETEYPRLVAAFRALSLPTDNCFFWLAGENTLVTELRRYVRRELDYDRRDIYAVPYWRVGFSEEQYHKERHKVMDEEPS